MKTIRNYEIIAFVTGFGLMAYELAAARLLAPSIGSSTYIWTSVIGVIIAALSIGYALGGTIADKRVKPSDIAWLLLAAAGGVLLTLVFADGTLRALQSVNDPRWQGLLASLLLFAPASFLLGIISPYLARLRTESLAHTGRAVASLSAMNAVGGIVGTFCVGFIFFGMIGSRETMLIVVGLLAAASWLILPKDRTFKRAALTAWIAFVAALQLMPALPKGVAADIDTPSSRYQVVNGEYFGARVRILTMGPKGSQSGVYTNGSHELVFDYTRHMAELVDLAPRKADVLILGGGAFTLPAYLADKHGDSHIDVVEIDPELVEISKNYFGYFDRPNVAIHTQDARAFLNANQKKYDLVLVDVYSDTSIPFAVTTEEYAAQLKRATKDDGAVIVNAIGANTAACGPLLRSIHGSYLTQFKDYKVQPLRDSQMRGLQNIAITYANQPLDWVGSDDVKLTGDIRLTDNFAPLEQLQQQCWDGEYAQKEN
ncbi:MAG TPA: fused MFS/spermidine synthase [Candidatus Saccharimonadales bacterium]|nr:fused MFS/spermidine synthase [Candidatus Saccharimonadales bacterium]